MKEETQKPFSFETSIQRLESILEKMNSGSAGLDETLKLYEEADSLISGCSKKLLEAEKRVETLIKTRNGDAQLDASGQPLKEPFGNER